MTFSISAAKLNTLVKSPYFLIVVFGAIWRIVLSFVFDVPAIHSDSRHYIELAQIIKSGDFSSYEGWRTPGYSFLLLLSGMNYTVLVVIQAVLGVLSSLMVYDLIKGYHRRLALFVALFVVSLINNISFEFGLLTELLTQFMVMLVVWFVIKQNLIRLQGPLWCYLVFSLMLTYLLLVRPMYVLMTPVVFVFMLFHLKRESLKSSVLKLLIVLLLPMGTYHLWNMHNYKAIGWYTVTPFYGINLAQHSNAYFDKLPDSESELKEIYLEKKKELGYNKERPASLKAYYNYFFIDTCETKLVWATCGEWGKRKGLEGYEYTHALYTIFTQLIADNPKDYLKGVLTAWVPFWNYSNYIMVDGQFQNPFLTKIIWRLQKLILLCLNMVFLLLVPLSFFSSFKEKRVFGISNYLAAIVLASSLSQAMVTYGDNNRFAVPTFLLLIIFVVVSLTRFKQGKSLSF